MGNYENTAALYINERAEDDATMTGPLDIGGVQYWFRAYAHTEGRDNKGFDLEFQKKETKGDNKGKGTIKKLEDEERASDTYPHWKGHIETANGDRYEIAGWRREPSGKATNPFLSFKLDKPREQPQEQPQQEQTKPEEKQGDFPF